MARQSRFGLTVFVALLLALVLFLFYFSPSILGAVVGVEETKTQTLDLKIESTETKTITLSDFPDNNYLSAFRLSGNLQTEDENADVKVYLQASGKKYLVFDYATVKDLAINHITGFAVSEGGGGGGGGDGGGGKGDGGGGEPKGESKSESPANSASVDSGTTAPADSSSSASTAGITSDSAAPAETSTTNSASSSETTAVESPTTAGSSSPSTDSSAESTATETPEPAATESTESQATSGSTSASPDSGNEITGSATAETSTETASETKSEPEVQENGAGETEFGSASDEKEKNKKQTYEFHDLCVNTCNLKNENLESKTYDLVFEISGEIELKISDASYGAVEKENQTELNPPQNETQNNETNANETAPAPNTITGNTVLNTGGTSPTGTTTETATTTVAPIGAALPATQETAPLATTDQPLAEVVASSPSSQTILFKSIDAGVPATSTISAPAVGITEVSFALKDGTSSMKLEVEALPERPVGIHGIGEGAAPAITGAAVASEVSAYQYLQLTVSGGATSSDISSAKIKFEVGNNWLIDNNYGKESVRLNRWHGGAWNELPTKLMSETPDSYAYKAESPGFSVFAITANRANTALRQTLATQPLVARADITTAFAPAGIAAVPLPSKGSTSWLLVLIAMAISYFIFANKNKRGR